MPSSALNRRKLWTMSCEVLFQNFAASLTPDLIVKLCRRYQYPIPCPTPTIATSPFTTWRTSTAIGIRRFPGRCSATSIAGTRRSCRRLPSYRRWPCAPG